METLNMNLNKFISLLFITFTLITSSTLSADERKGLILTKEGINNIQADLGNIPLFDNTLQSLKKEVDAEIANGFSVIFSSIAKSKSPISTCLS